MWPKRIVFEVRQPDIDQGLRMLGTKCPMALGLKRRLTELGIDYNNDGTAVGEGYAWIERSHKDGEQWVDTAEYRLSKPAHEFIYAFDHNGGDAVKPGRFAITLTRQYERITEEAH